jgi:hypothetical protein
LSILPLPLLGSIAAGHQTIRFLFFKVGGEGIVNTTLAAVNTGSSGWVYIIFGLFSLIWVSLRIEHNYNKTFFSHELFLHTTFFWFFFLPFSNISAGHHEPLHNNERRSNNMNIWALFRLGRQNTATET